MTYGATPEWPSVSTATAARACLAPDGRFAADRQVDDVIVLAIESGAEEARPLACALRLVARRHLPVRCSAD